MTRPASPSDPGRISSVRAGMRVLDADGADVGIVRTVDLGGPAGGADTEQGPSTSLMALVTETLSGTEPRNQPQLLANSEHDGYVMIVGDGLPDGRGYAAADQVIDVAGDVVRLGVAGDKLRGSRHA